MGKSYEVTGEIYKIDETKEYGTNGFKKREFIIKVTGPGENPEYPNYLKLELVKDKCDMIDGFAIGQEINVQFNLGGRLWAGNGKPETCFISLTAWKIEALTAAPAQETVPYTPPSSQAPAPQQFDDEFDVSGDSIPF